MKRVSIAAIVLLLLGIVPLAFSQSSNANLSGTVSDASGAIIPGVTVTATNNGTGVVSTSLSNDAGAYTFPSLLPGLYKVSAAQPGFQTHTFTDVQLGNAAQVRLNFSLQVSGLSQSVEVSVAGDRLLLESSSSIGTVLPEKATKDLPLVSNSALDLVAIMGGAVMTSDPIFGANNTVFAGVAANNINIQRDGVSVNDERWPTGINAPTRINPDLVGEVRMLLSPVDAEVGRGNGQVQVSTRSGTNNFHGAAVWNIQNTALDANQWQNNRDKVIPPWRNVNDYTVSVGGPIRKNKTFFFVLWDQQIARTRDAVNVLSLTPCAQKGIFRYFDGWNNGNRNTVTTASGTTPTIAVVDASGNPVRPGTNPDGTSYTGSLRAYSVFGPLTTVPTKADCSDAVVQQGAPWDQYRTGTDKTGYISNFLKLMPAINNYDIGDGLNTAGFRWNRTLKGADNLYGVGEDNIKKQINVRIDHYFSDKHKLNGSWSFEKDSADDSFANWPNGYGGINLRQPQVFTFNLTSTLRPTLLNEVRVGTTRTGTNVYGPLENPLTGDALRAMLPVINGEAVVIGPGAANNNAPTTTTGVNFQVATAPGVGGGFGGPQSSNFFGGRGIQPVTSRDSSPRWSYADTISWMKGTHSFRGGAEMRRASSQTTNYGSFFAGNTVPYASGGDLANSQITALNSSNMPGLMGTPGGTGTGNALTMANLLTFLSGSLNSVYQYRFINAASETAYNDPKSVLQRIRDVHQNEFALFFKDDWKIRPDLTLNIGLRYEYYGVPYLTNGLTTGFAGGSAALFGISGRDFTGMWNPGARADLTQLQFIGPDTANSSQKAFPSDRNNFGPAIGFAWQLPWFGKGKTTIRGGYQLSYTSAANMSTVEGVIGLPPGSVYTANYTGDSSTPYMDLTKLPSIIPVPLPTGIVPMRPIPVTERTQTMSAFDPNFHNPTIGSMVLAVTRNVTSSLTVDIRYIGTLSRGLVGTINLNAPDILNNGLLQAFNAARSGGESTLLNQIFNGINIAGAGYGPVGTTSNGVLQTGAMHLRAAASGNLRGSLANGDFVTLANTLNNLNYNGGLTGNGSLPLIPAGVNGGVLRYNNFAENFIKTNPQFGTANFQSNIGYSNYHSLQAQVTLRPTHGLNFQSTYTWSKNLGLDATGTYTNPLNRALDYTLLGSNRSHMLTTYGTWELPFAMLLRSNSGVIERVAKGWEASWIANLYTGSPFSVTAQNQLYGRGVPDAVGTFNKDLSGVNWVEGARSGNYFNNAYNKVKDPQCSAIAASLQPFCTIQALADAKTGQIVLQTPQPGTVGNFGQNNLTNLNTVSFDMALAKSIKITETKRIQFRIDARNILNHPMASLTQVASGTRRDLIQAAPDANLTSTGFNAFGALLTKVGVRSFQAKLRFDF